MDQLAVILFAWSFSEANKQICQLNNYVYVSYNWRHKLRKKKLLFIHYICIFLLLRNNPLLKISKYHIWYCTVWFRKVDNFYNGFILRTNFHCKLYFKNCDIDNKIWVISNSVGTYLIKRNDVLIATGVMQSKHTN